MRFLSISLNLLCFFLAFILPLSSEDKQYVPFKVEAFPHIELLLSNQKNDLNLTKLSGNIYEIQTTGNDPYIWFKSFKDSYQPNLSYVIAFEYQAPKDFGDFVFYCRTGKKTKPIRTDLQPSKEWNWFVFPLSDSGQLIGKKIDAMRMDLGQQDNQTFRIKNLRLIETSRELKLYTALGEKINQVDTFGIGLKDLKPQVSSTETVRYQDENSLSITKAVYQYLDLDAETKRLRNQSGVVPTVPLGPRIVAGEGPHPDNHTVIRILSPYQVCETQFLAYPPNISGGVGIETGIDGKGLPFIATWPLSSKLTRNIHLFNQVGGTKGKIQVSLEINPPYDLAVGDFLPKSPGDEIALTSKYAEKANPLVVVYSVLGKLLKRKSLTGRAGEYSLLTKNSNHLLIQELGRQIIHPVLSPQKGIAIPVGNKKLKVFDSVYPDREFNAGKSEETLSTLHLIHQERKTSSQNIGKMENIFWFDPQDKHNGDRATWGEFPNGKYVRNALYNYLGSAQYWSPLLKKGEIELQTYEEWTSNIDWEKAISGPDWRKSVQEYDQGKPTVWTAAFTHRWHTKKARPISSKVDTESGLPIYLLLDRKNDTTGGGYFGKRLFDYGSQHFENEALNKLYTFAQRAFYRKLAPAYRKNPEMTIAVEPNHENEIVSGSDSIGDYNPESLQGFYHYLQSMYGNLIQINKIMGTQFTADFFDAPRDLFRGEWDDYDFENRFFREWVEYNRIVVSRRVGTSYRECLLAGFPPEMIKCHQIPDSYVFKSIVGISEGKKRISPIDWLLTTGAGFGFSRYGTYYDREHNIGQGAYSSGFDNMLIGEYASLNDNSDHALQQLLYLRNHGVSTLHVMWWPSNLDKGFNQAQETALHTMISEHDKPCQGLAGGIMEIRPWKGKSKSYDIASLGTTDRHTGLIKSINQDGSFEGTVYSVPFHSHVDISVLNQKETLSISDSGSEIATIETTRPGSLIEVNFMVKEKTPLLRMKMKHMGVSLPDKTIRLENLNPNQEVRLVYKIPILMDSVSLTLSSPQISKINNLTVIKHQDQVVNLAKKIMSGKRHQGGVTFDCLPPSK